ncbi:hypothetical protein [Pontibacter sp. G13]|uniref:hypothetical protein n=1 Tax=Pontibacter sp. G13 TaxID=3074898 RepID=UPI0028894F3E|nr:hypothetical protein [Pontibacter sp. G13]WNJ19299.1 hypothetical protein RJD25_02305 [Pontibacter sp. G13]
MKIREWRQVGIRTEGETMNIQGINIWGHEWIGDRRKLVIRRLNEPGYDWAQLYEIRHKDQLIQFAALEQSNGVWKFFAEDSE